MADDATAVSSSYSSNNKLVHYYTEIEGREFFPAI